MCLELLCCCLGPSACGLCCKVGSGAKSSLTTRLLYVAFLVFVVVVSSIFLAPSIGRAVETSFLCRLDIDTNIVNPASDVNTGPVEVDTTLPEVAVFDERDVCREVFGYTSVYRICMAVASFFFVLMLIMICVISSKDPRAYIQNGFWCLKWIVVLGAIVGFFFIPRTDFIFSKVSLVIGMIGAFIFIILQVIFLVDFAHTWAESWLEKQKETENVFWYIALLIPTFIFYFIAIVGIILMFVFFVTPGECSLNIFFLCSIVVFSIIVSIIAILPWVQRGSKEYNYALTSGTKCPNSQYPTSGLLQASIVTLYTTYLTYSALSNEPYGRNNNCPLVNSTVTNVLSSGTNEAVASAFGIAIMFITVAYASIYLSNNKQIQKLRGNHVDDSEGYTVLCCDQCCPDATVAQEQDEGTEDDDDSDEKRMHVIDDEKEHVTYSYSFFHFMMVISTLFVMMQLTNWYNPQIAESDRFQNTWASVWVKMSSAWLCFVVYLWTLLAPLILRNRDFGYGADE